MPRKRNLVSLLLNDYHIIIKFAPPAGECRFVDRESAVFRIIDYEISAERARLITDDQADMIWR